MKGTVAIRTLAKVLTIEPYLAVAVNAIKVDEDRLAFDRSCLESFSIPADAAGKRATSKARRILLIECAFDGRDIERVAALRERRETIPRLVALIETNTSMQKASAQ